jgi:hypothetical protein
MLSRVGALCLAGLLGLAPAAVHAQEPPRAPGGASGADGERTRLQADLIEAQTRLVERAREYRASLETVLALEEAEAQRADALGRNRRDLFTRGLVSRREAEEAEALAGAALAKAAQTRARLAEAEAMMSETLAAIEVAKAPRAAPAEVIVTPTVVFYQGARDLVADSMISLQAFFAGRFGRALPVSASGQTAVHDRLGFDHRHAVDVAVHPDSDEGRALVEYLRRERIPFLAYRGPVPGASTGPHLHIGHASPRIVPARAAGR